MNRLRILELADRIENLEHVSSNEIEPPSNSFNMELFTFSGPETCGTPACICGWAVYLWGSYSIKERIGSSHGEKVLDITREQAQRLFFPRGADRRTPEEAANVLRRFAETGQVYWDEGEDDE